MKKLLLLLLCATSIYAKDFPDGLNNTKWKQIYLKDDKNYSVYEFNKDLITFKNYQDDRLVFTDISKMIDYQIHGNLLFVWYEDTTTLNVFEIRHDFTRFGEAILFVYRVNTEENGSTLSKYIPLVE